MQKSTSSESISGEMEVGLSQHMPPLSRPLRKRAGSSGSRKSARFNIPADSAAPAVADDDETYVEITLDVRGDSVAVHSVKTAAGGECEDPEVTLLARTLEKKSSFGSAVIRNASSKIRQVSQELKRLASLSTRSGAGRIERSKSTVAHALKGLKFIGKTDGVKGWPAVENMFDEEAKDGLLPKPLFGKCIGMKESEFAGELFDALARRRNMTGDSITKEELKEFWDQISDESFDCRLQTFFDM